MFTRISSAFHNRRLPQLQYLRSLCSESSSSDKPPSSSNLPTDSKSKLTVAEKAESKSVSKPRDRHIIIGPDNVPYDPSEDPYYTPSLSHYRYPQYFTKDLGNKRTWRAIKNDVELMKKGRIHPTREELPCPSQVDVCIFGGGIIGSAIAYFIKDRAPFSLSVGVIERDPTVSIASLRFPDSKKILSIVHASINNSISRRNTAAIFPARKYSHVNVRCGFFAKCQTKSLHIEQ